MNNVLDSIKKEWERTTFMVVLFVTLVVCGMFVMKLMDTDDGGSNFNSGLPARPNFFNMNSLAYLDPPKMSDVINPMAFRHSIVLPKPVTPPQQKKPEQNTKPNAGPAKPAASATGPAKPNPSTPVQTPGKTEPAKPAIPVKPKVPPRKIKVMYSGYSSIEGASAKAWVSASEAKTKKRASGRYEKGSKLLGAVEIVSFDADKMVIKHSGNKTVTINKGKKNEQEVTVQ